MRIGIDVPRCRAIAKGRPANDTTRVWYQKWSVVMSIVLPYMFPTCHTPKSKLVARSLKRVYRRKALKRRQRNHNSSEPDVTSVVHRGMPLMPLRGGLPNNA